MKPASGGPAFPQPGVLVDGEIRTPMEYGEGGMSLRDYIATKAMQAEIITSCSDATPKSADALVEAACEAGRDVLDHIALNAYKMADAMLRAREVSE